MNLIVGEKIKVLDASDPGQVGLAGEVLLETSKTILVDCGGQKARIQKHDTVLQVEGRGEVIRGDEILGRLEERIARASA